VEDSPPEVFQYIEGFHLPKTVRFYSIGKAEFASFIGETTNVEAPAGSKTESDGSFTLETIRQDAPVVNIINSICIEAIRLGASDIHIETQEEDIRVRYRVDGMLRTVKKIDRALFHQISNRVKIMANMNTLEQRLPQDGRMRVVVEGDSVDLRVSVVPSTSGESVVLRLFNKSTERLGLTQLGFAEADLDKIRQAIRLPYGLILLTGPTGSGKTTTLHALIGTLPADGLKIITIEDPVEQLIAGITQIQIHEEIELTFESMLRRVLRQDPNVIMVGEIRDAVTAELALRSALTGHLILSTLHTNDSISVIARLANMGLEPYLIAAVLKCSVAQRLVRKVCPVCSREVKPDDRIAGLFGKYRIKGRTVRQAAGCPSCDNSGYKGRIVIGEVFPVDTVIEQMIAGRRSATEIAAYAGKNGMRSIAEDALRKLASGVTTQEEIEREVVL
jgi:general secretion pathway protein E/type IV pilus assembly protein PilB